MNCPVCGWIDGFYHTARHVMINRCMKLGSFPPPPGGPWRPVPTWEETCMIVGLATEEEGRLWVGAVDEESLP